MGVTGLWTVVQPCARPAKLETLNKKRLAVDASIWIYQFLKAVRDKEGNALRNSHVVGFFRRICKLLFVGIKPVFVFDGGAPILKRQTVSTRKARREGRREDAVRTAGKLLAVQMQRRAEEDDKRRREERDKPQEEEDEELPDEPIYVEDIGMSAEEKQQSRSFKKKDAYHLPDLDTNFAEMGAPNDPRIMSHEELEEYARQFHTGEDVNVYDFSNIDFNSDFFTSLPASDRYNILNAARLRSRLRMGYSKEQLDIMFPDRMAFSRFQIERVKERNELTQRLMNINGMNGEDNMFGVDGGMRIAGEKGKEYVLVKNEGVEGGWALGVVSNKSGGERNKPIDVEKLSQEVAVSDGEEQKSEEDGFEDIPIEGLNRLPRRRKDQNPTLADFNDSRASDEIAERRKAVYATRQQRVNHPPHLDHSELAPPEDPDSLFVPETEEPEDELFEDVSLPEADEEEDLQKAIAMSLEAQEDKQPDSFDTTDSASKGLGITRRLDFNATNAKHGRDFAHQTNARAHIVLPKGKKVDDQDLETAPATPSGPRVYGLREETGSQVTPYEPQEADAQSNTFKGPLPFESLNLGKSILSKKKEKVESEGGGFDKDAQPAKPAQPLPPWFSGDVQKDTAAQKRLDLQQYAEAEEEANLSAFREKNPIRRQETKEIIDVDAPVETVDKINIDSSEDEAGDEIIVGDSRPLDHEIRMEDVADLTRAEPPVSVIEPQNPRPRQRTLRSPELGNESKVADDSESEAAIEWEQSDIEADKPEHERFIAPDVPLGRSVQKDLSQAASPQEAKSDINTSSPPQCPSRAPEDEGISIPKLADHLYVQRSPSPNSPSHPPLSTELSLNLVPADISDDEDQYSDPEDADLFRQLAAESSEHARFASSLSKSAQSAEDYERELRQLRNQQKKDRRDADEVSHIMVTECQQLLKLFGIPYITAPMEAEAQCAELVRLGLVDGIVTDDSDIFLFGGTRVYKNMFNQAKFVECYLASDLEKEYALTRQKLISIAHLLGSDYTEGLPSVGPVTALEILGDFGTLDTFAKWWEAVQTAPPPPSKSAAAHTDPLSSTPFRRKFRKTAATKLFLPTSFPDSRVDAAYLHPEVDSDPSAFAWGVPDLDSLRSFLMATIGWTQERTDEILVPVIKDMNRREVEGTQANITKFFDGGVGVGAKAQRSNGAIDGSAPRRRGEGNSKRMENALGNLAQRARKETRGSGDENNGVDDDREKEVDDGAGSEDVIGKVVKAQSETKGRKEKLKRKRPRTLPPVVRNGNSVDRGSTDDDTDEYQAPSRTRRKRGGGKPK